MGNKVFKVGERVAADWYNPSDYTYTRVKGWYNGPRGPTVVAVSQESDEENPAWLCSKHSMRRLRPKKRREFWISMHPCSEPRIHKMKLEGTICGSGCKIEWLHVKECIAQKAKT